MQIIARLHVSYVCRCTVSVDVRSELVIGCVLAPSRHLGAVSESTQRGDVSSHGYTLCATVVVRVGVRSELVIGCVLAPSRHLGGCLKVPSGDVSSHGYTLCATVVVRVGVRSELVIGYVLAPY